MAVFHVFLLVLVFSIVRHCHGRTNESESITINGSTDTFAVEAPSYGPLKPPTNGPPWKPQKYQYDNLLLVLQWPKSLCNTGFPCTSQIPNYFTLHGLWPQPYIRPFTCNSPHKSLNSYYNQLDLNAHNYMVNYWPTINPLLYTEWLWDHEYREHGSCFSPFKEDPPFYFLSTVDLAMQIGNVTDILLDQGGIQRDKRYSLSNFKSAISGLLKYIPMLQCNRLRQLYELRFCIKSLDGKLTPYNCSNNLINLNCGYSVMIPGP